MRVLLGTEITSLSHHTQATACFKDEDDRVMASHQKATPEGRHCSEVTTGSAQTSSVTAAGLLCAGSLNSVCFAGL